MGLPKGVEAKETGHADLISRVRAARKLMAAIADRFDGEWERHVNKATAQFLTDMDAMFADWDDLDFVENEKPTAKQYFWLKDIYDKHVVGG